MKIAVSGLINIETSVKVRGFPIAYYPIDYAFFGVKSVVSGVAYNITKSLAVLENEPNLISFLGNDPEGTRVLAELNSNGLSTEGIFPHLAETPTSVVLYEESGRRQIYCDLKNIQDQTLVLNDIRPMLENCEWVILCNVNFNRTLLREIKAAGKRIATDVHVLSAIDDAYNRDFMEHADTLFLSDEKINGEPETFLLQLKDRYPASIIVISRGEQGALLYDRRKDEMTRFSAAKVGPVVNTIGAGDALFSSFLNYTMRGYSPIEAMIRAETFAALKIRFSGASVGFPTASEVEAQSLLPRSRSSKSVSSERSFRSVLNRLSDVLRLNRFRTS